MSLEGHTRKQVQMNAVARHLTKKFAKNVPPEFGRIFEYIKVFFAVFKEQPVTVEEYVEGEFQKYVNNNGMCITSPADGFDEIYAKAQCLVHFSFPISERKLMLLDIQGSSFKLYDPELQQQIFLLMMNHWVQKRSISVLETFPVLQLIHLSQSTFVISIVRLCLSNSLIKIDLLTNDASIDPKEVNFYAGNLSYNCNWFI